MRNLSNSSTFLDSVDSIVEENLGDFLLRDQVIVNPNFLDEYEDQVFLPRDLDSCIILGIFYSYMDDKVNFKWYLGEALAERSENEDFAILRYFLGSKTQTQLFLLESQRWSTRDFFGNLLTRKNIQHVTRKTKFRRKQTKVSLPARKRGYNDKGSMREDHRWLPSNDWTLDCLQEEIEKKRLIIEETFLLSLGLIE